jgi:hypothetical protein
MAVLAVGVDEAGELSAVEFRATGFLAKVLAPWLSEWMEV